MGYVNSVLGLKGGAFALGLDPAYHPRVGLARPVRNSLSEIHVNENVKYLSPQVL